MANSKVMITVIKSDTDDINQEILALEVEIQILTKRAKAVRSRRMDQPIPDMQSRLSGIQERLVELEPLVIEDRLLSAEADFLRTAIASQTQAVSDLYTTEVRIASLERRRNIILRLSRAAETESWTQFEAT